MPEVKTGLFEGSFKHPKIQPTRFVSIFPDKRVIPRPHCFVPSKSLVQIVFDKPDKMDRVEAKLTAKISPAVLRRVPQTLG
jgi:hypothetical protein